MYSKLYNFMIQCCSYFIIMFYIYIYIIPGNLQPWADYNSYALGASYQAPKCMSIIIKYRML